MIVDVEKSTLAFDQLIDELQVLGEAIEVDIRLQHEDIFESMHRI